MFPIHKRIRMRTPNTSAHARARAPRGTRTRTHTHTHAPQPEPSHAKHNADSLPRFRRPFLSELRITTISRIHIGTRSVPPTSSSSAVVCVRNFEQVAPSRPAAMEPSGGGPPRKPRVLPTFITNPAQRAGKGKGKPKPKPTKRRAVSPPSEAERLKDSGFAAP